MCGIGLEAARWRPKFSGDREAVVAADQPVGLVMNHRGLVTVSMRQLRKLCLRLRLLLLLLLLVLVLLLLWLLWLQ